MPLTYYLKRLEESGLNFLVFRNREVIFSSGGNGITPIVDAIDSLDRECMRGVITADRIVGRAAALLNIYLGASEVHAMLITKGAKQTLLENGVEHYFRQETDAIKTRDGVIYCPFEKMVQDILDPEEAYLMIKKKLFEFRSVKN
jgi:hypothetical protein